MTLNINFLLNLKFKKLLQLICWGSFFIVFAANAAVISDAQISGNTVWDDDTIQKVLSVGKWAQMDSVFMAQKMDELIEKYRDKGYWYADINWQINQNEVLNIEIIENTPVILDRLILTGNQFLKEEQIFDLMDTKIGKNFTQSTFEEDIERILSAYENNGFPYCEINIGPLDESEGKLVITIYVDENERVKVERIVVFGNSITRKDVITREMRIPLGDNFSVEKLERARQYLEKTGFFRTVSAIELRRGKTNFEGVLVVNVEEGKTNRLNGVLGYIPQTDDQDGYFTGLLDFSFQNLMGTGRKANVRWNRQDEYSSFLRFGYLEPWVMGFPVTAGFEMEQTIQDSTYTKRKISLLTEMPLSDTILGNIVFTREEVISGSRANNWIENSTKQDVKFGAKYDTRNSLLNPSDGSFYHLSVSYGKRKYKETGSSIQEGAFVFNSLHIIPTFRRQAISVSFNGAFATSEEDTIPYHERFSLGGARSLRGYKEDQFRGSHIGWSNWEYRFLLSRYSRFFVFCDTGYFYYKKSDSIDSKLKKIDGVKIGYGLGLRIESGIGIIGVDYGLGEEKSLMQGKLHFGLEEEF